MKLFVYFTGMFGALTLFSQNTYGDNDGARVEGFEVQRLHSSPIGDAPGKNAVVVRVTLQPSVTETAHTHPGVEIVYVLEGRGIINLDHNTKVALRKGEVVRVEKGQIKALQNTSETEQLAVIAFIVADDDKPVASAVD